jgi:hypothetical protein
MGLLEQSRKELAALEIEVRDKTSTLCHERLTQNACVVRRTLIVQR